jgi:hypothetical protein
MKKILPILAISFTILLLSSCSLVNIGKRKEQPKPPRKKTPKQVQEEASKKLHELEQEKLLEEEQKKYLYEKYYKNAYNEYINANYNKALYWIEKLLEIIPNDKKALELQAKVKSALGELSSHIKTTQEMLEDRMKIYIESVKAEIRSYIKKAENYIKDEDYKSAKIIINTVEEKLTLLPYDIGLAAEKEKIKTLKALVQKKIIEKERTEEIRRKEAIRKLALIEEQKQAQERKKELEKLSAELRANIKRKNYIEARRIANRILSIDPKNKSAIKILDLIPKLEAEYLAEQALKNKEEYRKKEELKIKEKEIAYSDSPIVRYPERHEWEDILKKSEKFTEIKPPLKTETPLMKEISRKLQEFHEIEVKEEDKTAAEESEKVATFADLITNVICAKKLKLDPTTYCQIDESASQALNKEIYPLKFEATVPISEILKQILNPLGVSYTITPFGLKFLAKGQEEEKIVKTYNITDILLPTKTYPDVEQLIDVKAEKLPEETKEEVDLQKITQDFIENTLPTIFGVPKPEAQTSSPPYEATSLGKGQIYLKAPLSFHQKFAQYIEGVKQATRIQVSIEGRFLVVDDNFLQDIGVEWRGLQDSKQVLSIIARDGGTEDAPPSPGNLPNPLSSGFVETRAGDSVWEIKARTQFPSANLSGQLQNIGGLGLQFIPLSGKQMSIALRAIAKKESATQLQATRIIVTNNSYTFLRFIRELTIIKEYKPGGSSGALTPNPEVIRVGTILMVKPIVSYDKKYISLEVFPQIVRLQGAPREIDASPSEVGAAAGRPRAPIQLPWTVSQSAFTTVRIPDKGSVIIAGLRNMLNAKFTERVPVLGRLPIIGALFRRKQKVIERRNSVILLTAEIIDMQEQEQKNF